MRIGLLQCDDVPEPLGARYGSYSAMVQKLLHAVDPQLTFEIWRCHEGEIPEADAPVDAWITTGSRYGANDSEPWIESLSALIRALWDAQRPLVGLCFGHQLIAHAMGGRVERSQLGWGVGVSTNTLDAKQPWMTPWNDDEVRLLVSHQDQVTQLPEHGRVLAHSEFCPIYMMQVGDVFLGVQGHPEFSKEFAADLMSLRRGVIPEERIDAGMDSLKTPVDDLTVARWIVNFLRRKEMTSP